MTTQLMSSELRATTREATWPSVASSEPNPTLWERITVRMTESLCLEEVLKATTQGLVDEFGAALARIWILGPGDVCVACTKAEMCADRSCCLHLMASSGLSTNLNGEHRRMPLGILKIGQIAQSGQRHCTNDVMNDERIPNKQWLRDNGLRSFAGYPLVFQGHVLGVLGLFSQKRISSHEFSHLTAFAHQTAIAIKNAQLFEEVAGLKDRLERENISLKEDIDFEQHWQDIVGRSDALKQVLKLVPQVAPTSACVLIQGETGTGKELIARAIHRLSGRNERAFIKLNCAAIPTGLLESELFGHEKGAFTGAIAQKAGRFELADHGTIFLDEVGEIPPELQTKLLRVLQEQEFERLGSTRTIKVDVRVIAATNRDLAQMVEAREFRADLYYRLDVFPLTMPPLRERREDIPLLTRYFVDHYATRMHKQIDSIPGKTLEALSQYHWPGNVRELENLIERAMILTQGPVLNMPLAELKFNAPPTTVFAQPTLESAERDLILRTLEKTNWLIGGATGTATKLGIKRTTLISRMQKLNITRPPR